MHTTYTYRRASSPLDADKLYDLYQSVFHPEDVGTLARTLFHHLPGMKPDYWFMAEDKKTRTIVSAFALIPWTWEMHGIHLKVAEMGIVGTLEDHRHRGLMRALNAEFDRTLGNERFDIAVIQGIPGFYHHFGYHYAVTMENHVNLPLYAIPERPKANGFTIRPAGLEDIVFLLKQDDAYRKAYLISSVRTEANWRYLFNRSFETEYGSDFWIVENNRSEPCSYCRISRSGFGQGLIVSEVGETADEETVMRLFSFFREKALQAGKPYIRLNLHLDSPSSKTALCLGAQTSRPYAWQVKIPDPANLVRKLAPVLERRLSDSPYGGFSGVLRLDLFRTSIDLVWRDGRMASVRPGDGTPCRYTFCVAEDLLPALLLGHRTWQELQSNRPDIFPSSQYVRPSLVPDRSGLLMDVLFPSARSWIFGQY